MHRFSEAATVYEPDDQDEEFMNPMLGSRPRNPDRNSTLSLASIVGEKKDFELQKVNPFFTDPNKDYTKVFEQRLDKLNGKTAQDELCIEEYLTKSEKDWFNRLRDVKLGKSPNPSVFGLKLDHPESLYPESTTAGESVKDQFLLQDDYAPPTGIRRFLLRTIGDWPFYSLLLALGQIIAANSYQITLLTGEVGESASKLYVVASIYLITSIGWWTVYRTLKSVYVLSLPFLFYGLAFFLVGVVPFVPSMSGRGWVQNVATGCYAIASSSGSIFFALNFGDQGGAPVVAWVYRACVIQGTQQVYVAALWWWGKTSFLCPLTSPASQTHADRTSQDLSLRKRRPMGSQHSPPLTPRPRSLPRLA